MRSIKFVLSVTLISVVLTSCFQRDFWGIKGKGEDVTETRPDKGFDRISLSIDGDVYYTQDSIHKIEVVAQSNILKVLKTEVSGGELKITYIRNVWDHNKVKIYVHSPKMHGLKISGSGDIKGQNKISTDKLELSISGSGNISIPSITAEKLTAKISGSGDITVDGGVVTDESFNISGSGDINTEFLISQTNTSGISGSGNIVLQATESLDVTISGSGDVRYRGKPVTTVQISGSGKVRHID
jgi:hypothetical protein